jgi:hypothetical protein
MPDAPLSRRARRTFEEEAADRAALNDPTLSLAPGLSSGEIPDASQLSRRDRRRLERLARPLEAWTAEEEMLATGQIPAMTPERIAEQERISREKAMRAAQDAASASQELRVLAEAEARQAAWAAELPSQQEPVRPFVNQPAPAQPVVRPPAPDLATGQFAETAYAEPANSEPQHDAPASRFDFPGLPPEAESPDGRGVAEPPADAPASTEPSGGYQPRLILEDEPLAPVVHADTHRAPDVAPEPVQAPDSGSFPTGSIATGQSRVLDELFPPGSNQAALRQQDPFAHQAAQADAPAPASSDAIPTLLPPQDGPTGPSNPVEEIRRLAAEAMSGIERASRSEEAAPQQTPAQQTPSQPVPVQQAPVRGQSWDEVVAAGSAAPASQQAYDALGMSRADEPVPTTTPGGGLAPHHAAFDQLASNTQGAAYGAGIDERRQAPASGQFPSVQSGQFPTQSGQFPTQSGQFPTQSGQFPSVQAEAPGVAPQPLTHPQGPAWATHPLEAAQPTQPAHADPNDFKPVTDAPKPDFSGLYQTSPTAQFGPGSASSPTGQFGTVSGTIPTGHMSTNPSGTIRRLDMPDVGGAKHFKWLHLAVIGALMFVLGVVIYNAAFAQ